MKYTRFNSRYTLEILPIVNPRDCNNNPWKEWWTQETDINPRVCVADPTSSGNGLWWLWINGLKDHSNYHMKEVW